MTSHVLQEAIKAHEGFITAQPAEFRFILPLLRLLAGGAPVELRQLATVAHCSQEEIQAVVPSSDVEVAQAGNMVGSCPSLVPTPHLFHLGEHTLYTWCALDAPLVSSPALLAPRRRVSVCPQPARPSA